MSHDAHSDFQDWQARAGKRRGGAGVARISGVIAQWVKRLKTELAADGGGAVEVKGAAALAAALADPGTIKRDSVYVLYAAEDADGNIQANGVRQRCVIGVTVALAVTHRRERRDEAGVEEAEALAWTGAGGVARLGAAGGDGARGIPARPVVELHGRGPGVGGRL